METPSVIPAVSVAVLRAGTILLVRRGRPPSAGLYAFPGGKAEPGETLEQAARRETMEETALVLTGLAPIETIDIPFERDGQAIVYRLTVFTAQAPNGIPVAGDEAA
jgi:ADP-ribose pyrophosphatase YjhB (NUDIX family)